MDDGLHPQVRDLLDKSDGLDWLFMNKLKAGDVLAVRTCNTLYTMELINSEKISLKIGELYSSGRIGVEILKDEATLVMKGYKAVYDEISGNA